MDTIQLTLILRKDKFTRGVFQGVYHVYQVFHITQPCTSPMWTQVTSQVRIGWRFISPRSKTSLNNNSNKWIFNTVTLQSIYSKVCGHYCLYFGLFCSRQISMSTIVHRFSKNIRLVKRFIQKKFSYKSSEISHWCKQTKSTSLAQTSVNKHLLISFYWVNKIKRWFTIIIITSLVVIYNCNQRTAWGRGFS